MLYNCFSTNNKLCGHFQSLIPAKRHHIQLDVTFPDIDRNKDTNDLWALLKKSAVTKGTYNNSQNLRNEWANFKQYTLDEESHVVSLTPHRNIKTNFRDIRIY